MKKYNKPLAEMVAIDTRDIMVTSGGQIIPQNINDPFVYSPWGMEDF